MYLNQFFQPCDTLQPYIAAIYALQSSEPFDLCVMPQPTFTLSFNYQGEVYLRSGHASHRIPAAVINGGHDSYKRCHVARNTGIIVVQFKACAVTSFFDFPGPDRLPSSYRLADLIDQQEMTGLEQGLGTAMNNSDRVEFIEQFLCNRLRTVNPDPLADAAACKIREAGGNLKIGELCKMLYISESQFEKRFRKAVGISAKKYASLVRISNVLTDNRINNNITDKAYEAGYFDQAHFIRDFKAYTGYTPLRFFKLRAKEHTSFIPLGLIEPAHQAYA